MENILLFFLENQLYGCFLIAAISFYLFLLLDELNCWRFKFFSVNNQIHVEAKPLNFILHTKTWFLWVLHFLTIDQM